MATHDEAQVHTHFDLDVANWPVAVASVTVAAFAGELWAYVPGPTAMYMVVSAGFMLFQMAEKLGLLERFKKHTLLITVKDDPPDDPPAAS